MFLLVLVLLVMLIVIIYSLQKLLKKHTMKVREDVEEFQMFGILNIKEVGKEKIPREL